MQSFDQPNSNSGGGLTPVLFSEAFSLLTKDVRQRKLSFYGGRAKRFVAASVGEKKGGIFLGKNFNKYFKKVIRKLQRE